MIKLPEQVNKAICLLKNSGFEAYAVGGAVRDCLLGKVPFDWDITTSARPEETEKVFCGERIIETGIKHGTVTVIIDGMPLEITTYRIDGDYTDHRHPRVLQGLPLGALGDGGRYRREYLRPLRRRMGLHHPF